MSEKAWRASSWGILCGHTVMLLPGNEHRAGGSRGEPEGEGLHRASQGASSPALAVARDLCVPLFPT